MNLHDLHPGEPWLSPNEIKAQRRITAALRAHFRLRQAPDSPLLALRIDDLLAHFLIARRLEQGLRAGEETGAAPITGALAEQIGKARERLRRAIGELEELCGGHTAAPETGLADHLLPLVKRTAPLLQAQGVASVWTDVEEAGETTAAAD